METPRIYRINFAHVYPLYIEKVAKKGRTQADVDSAICWLTEYSTQELQDCIERQLNLEQLFAKAPRLNPKRSEITGLICGLRVEEIKDPLTQNIRYMDKLIDEIAKGKEMNKVLRA